MKKFVWGIVSLFVILQVLPKEPEAASFKDVSPNQYYYEAVEWGYKNKIISGDGTGYFRPEDTITHGQFIKMFTEFYNFDVQYDASLPLFDEYYNALKDYAIQFEANPKKELITRGEIAALIMVSQNAYYNRQDDYSLNTLLVNTEAISKYMFDHKLSNGVTTANVPLDEKYGFFRKLKRADAIQFLFNLQHRGFDQLKITPIVAQPLLKPDSVVRSFKAPNGVEFSVLSKYYANYSAVFVYDGKVIGGYESDYKKTFEGIRMGKPLASEDLYYNRKMTIAMFMDNFSNKLVHSIFWTTKDRAYQGLIEEALENTSENQDFLSSIYVELVNEFRAKHAAGEVSAHPILQKAAVLHSIDMATNDYFSHASLDGSRSWQRVLALDPSFNLIGENLSGLSPHLFVAHNGWINSKGHRENMLEEGHKFVGFGSAIGNGRYIRYYTVVLGATFSN